MADWRSVKIPTREWITWGELCGEFIRFCETLTIDSKEHGSIKLRLNSSQIFLVLAIFSGLTAGFHDFVILKARQLGASTVLWAFDLFWLMKFPGIQGFYVADSEPNKELHRDQIGQMLESVPTDLRRRVRVNNRLQLAFRSSRTYRGGRLMFSAANLKNKGQLGRSRGVNYVHAEEMDSWEDPEALGALSSALAEDFPLRVYFWVGTGQGFSVLYEMWEQAENSVVSQQVFLGWWRLDTRVIAREIPDPITGETITNPVWTVFGEPPPSQDEAEWMAEVERRFGFTIRQEQLAWWRFTKRTGKGINDNEAVALQEHPWLPEQAFQAGGSAFVSATTALRMRTSLSRAPEPMGYRYDWGLTFDERGDEALTPILLDDGSGYADDTKVKILRDSGATLILWDEPMTDGLYIVSGDPAYGSSEKADSFAVTVWRAFPDQLVQCATYESKLGTMYQFAWVLAHLSCNYGRWLIYDINGPGRAVLQELQRLKEQGLGLTRKHAHLQDVIASIQEYLWSRPDTLLPTYSRQWQTSPMTQEPLMEQLRNEVERGSLVIRDPALVSQVAALRRKDGRIEPGGVAHDDLAVTAAMAVEYWLQSDIMEEVAATVSPRQGASEAAPAAQVLLRSFLHRISVVDQESDLIRAKTYGVTPGGPGR